MTTPLSRLDLAIEAANKREDQRFETLGIYLGVKKNKPKPVKTDADIMGVMGGFMARSVEG